MSTSAGPSSYASPVLGLPGAVAADPPDRGVAAHYGNPLGEQRRLAAGDAFVDLSHRGVVRVSGPDRLSWLHSLTTQHLERLQPNEAADALILSPRGHIEHHLALVDDGESVWTHVEPHTQDALVRFLESMRFMLRVEVHDETAARAVMLVPDGGDAGPGDVPARVVAHGRELFLPREAVARYGDAEAVGGGALGGPAGMWALEALRIEAHRPRLGLETDDRTIPNEVGWLSSAVHLDKGCYRGQETVAKVHNLGAPPRRLVFLHLDGSGEVLPPHGAPVELDGRQVGFVTSSARHYELGPIALALVKRAAPTDAALLAGGVPATQEPVVPVEPPHHRPRVGLPRP